MTAHLHITYVIIANECSSWDKRGSERTILTRYPGISRCLRCLLLSTLDKSRRPVLRSRARQQSPRPRPGGSRPHRRSYQAEADMPWTGRSRHLRSVVAAGCRSSHRPRSLAHRQSFRWNRQHRNSAPCTQCHCCHCYQVGGGYPDSRRGRKVR